jgi:endonuclease YncB( thermonuclease family)
VGGVGEFTPTAKDILRMEAMVLRIVGVWCCVIIAVGIVGTNAFAWEGTATRILDGDTILVRSDGGTVTIRLYGIDCPEYGQPYWQEAKEAVQDMVLGKRVRIESMDTDQYGRTVALVGVRGGLVNAELVRQGMAWVYTHYCKQPTLCHSLHEIEDAARMNRVGLWRERKPTPPWVWKHSRR